MLLIANTFLITKCSKHVLTQGFIETAVVDGMRYKITMKGIHEHIP